MKPFSIWEYSQPKVLKKCPICGGELEVNNLCQYSIVYRILKSGKISKNKKLTRDEGSMECFFYRVINAISIRIAI